MVAKSTPVLVTESTTLPVMLPVDWQIPAVLKPTKNVIKASVLFVFRR
jgi:hypothetical protein